MIATGNRYQKLEMNNGKYDSAIKTSSPPCDFVNSVMQVEIAEFQMKIRIVLSQFLEIWLKVLLK